MLSKLLNLNKYPIALSISQYGLVDWISEIEKYDGKLMIEVNNSDHEFLEKLFELVDHVPDKIKRIIKAGIEIDDDEIITTISKFLSKKRSDKYINPFIYVISPKLSLSAFCTFKDNFDPKIEINLNDFITVISPELTSYIKAYNHGRIDNAYTILMNNSNLSRELEGNRRYSKITQLTDENKQVAIRIINELIDDDTIPEYHKIDEFMNVFDLGNLTFKDDHSLIQYAGMDMKNLWILQAISPTNLIFLKILESLYSKKKVGEYFLNSLKNLDFGLLKKRGLGNGFISSFLASMNGSYILSKDNDNQTIFHYISRFNSISNESMNLLILSMQKYNSRTRINVMNERSRE